MDHLKLYLNRFFLGIPWKSLWKHIFIVHFFNSDVIPKLLTVPVSSAALSTSDITGVVDPTAVATGKESISGVFGEKDLQQSTLFQSVNLSSEYQKVCVPFFKFGFSLVSSFFLFFPP
jgi:hypothetical protein